MVFNYSVGYSPGQCKSLATPLHDLLPNIPIMALSATITNQVEEALKCLLNEPLILRNTVNRENIFLAAEPCNFKRKDGSKQSVSLDSRDFNSFGERVKDIIGDECSIVYTDFACHVGSIVITLRDRDVKAIGYYGKMKKQTREMHTQSGKMTRLKLL